MRRWLLIATLVLAACASNVTPTMAPTPGVTPAVGATTAPAAPTPIATQSSAIDAGDLSIYRAAMRPEFAQDIDRFTAATRYQIDLTIAPDRASYSATQHVRYTNTETATLNEVYFRLFPNTFSYGGVMTVTAVRANDHDVKPVMELDNSALKIELAEPLQPGKVVNFDLVYATTVPTRSIETGYNQFGLNDGILTLPDFYPLIPVYDDEGWNVELAPGIGDAVFSDSALYQVNILAPKDQVIVTSGTCESQAAPVDMQYQRCVSGPMRDFMIGLSAKYQVASETVDGIKVSSYFVTADESQGKRGLEIVVASIKSYQKRIGLYPFAELDLIETPTTAGGIEYPSVIVIAQELFERNPDFHESATAHEVAHQWWYSLVGDDQVDEPWLDEAFTQFTTALYYLDRYGKDSFDSYVQQGLQSRYDRVKGTAEDKRADRPVADYSPRQYSAIVYGKAALFFNALYEKIGDSQFNQFMQAYFETYRYGIAYPKDLLAVAAKYIDQKTVDELVEEWITGP